MQLDKKVCGRDSGEAQSFSFSCSDFTWSLEMLWEESGFKNRKRSRPSALAPTSPPPSEQLTHVCLTHCIRISHQISFELGLPCEKKTTWRIFKFKSRNLSDSPARLSNRGGICAGTTFNRMLLEEERMKKPHLES